MLRNIFLKTLRDNRAGILGWGLGLGLLVLVNAALYPTLVTGTEAQRAKAVAGLTQALQAFAFLLGEITSLDTIGGFLTSRILGFLAVMLALWAAVVGVGLIRGEEQQGALDALLSTPHSRSSALLQKVAALLVAVFAVSALTIAGTWVGVLAAGETVSTTGLVEVGVNLLGAAFFWGVVGLLVGQFTVNRRQASSITGGLIFGTYLLNNVFEASATLKPLSWVLPFHYVSLSKPLAQGHTMQWGAWLVLVIAALACVAITDRIFTRRDLGASFALLPARATRPSTSNASSSRAYLLGSVFGKSLRDLIGQTVAWGLGLGAFGALIVAVTNEALGPFRQMTQSAPWISKLMGDLGTNEGFLSASMGTYIPVLISVFAIIQVGAWAGDEEEGQLEVLVAMPIPRGRILLARYLAIVASLVVILALTCSLILLASALTNVSLNPGRVIAGLAAALPVGLLVAAAGLALATWLPRPGAAMPIMIALVVAMFFLDTLGPLLDLPDLVRDLSIFHLYGRPLIEGVQWGGLIALTVGVILFAAASLLGLAQRDIAK